MTRTGKDGCARAKTRRRKIIGRKVFLPETKDQLDFAKSFRHPSFLQHTLAVADCMIAIEIACRNSPDIELIRLENISKWDVSFSHKGKTTALTLIPDKIFGLQKGEERNYFFLEADRGTKIRFPPLTRRSAADTCGRPGLDTGNRIHRRRLRLDDSVRAAETTAGPGTNP